MKPILYYFSGTGNTLVTTRKVANKIDGKIVPIPIYNKAETVEPEADIFGILFPVYYADLPIIVREFTNKLSKIEDKYIFTVCTYGGSAGITFDSLDKIIKARGGKISLNYGIHLPQNAFNKPWANNKKIQAKLNVRIKKLVKYINNKKEGTYSRDIIIRVLANSFTSKFQNMYKKELVKISGYPIDSSMDILIHNADNSYKVNEDCNGCGICKRVCPVNNIEMVSDEPKWLNKCENCLACYNFCPKKAIKGGVVVKDYYYTHPDISYSDMIIDR